MHVDATGKSRLAIRPNACGSAIAALGIVVGAVYGYFGKPAEGIFWSVLFAILSLRFYLQGVTIDRRAGIVRKRGGLFTCTSRLLIDFDRVVLTRVAGKRVRSAYEVGLFGAAEAFGLISDDYFSAREHAERIARFLAMDIYDSAFGQTVVHRRREPATTPEPEPTNHGPTDEADLLSIRDEPPDNWLLVLLVTCGMAAMCAILVSYLLVRVLMVVSILFMIFLHLGFVFSGVAIDRRRFMVTRWRVLPRFRREVSLSGYHVVSVALHVTQSEKESRSSICFVWFDGDREPFFLKAFDDPERAHELAQRVAGFLDFEVRDLTKPV